MNPLIGLVMGSQSDWDTLKEASQTLDALQLATQFGPAVLALGQQADGTRLQRQRPAACHGSA